MAGITNSFSSRLNTGLNTLITNPYLLIAPNLKPYFENIAYLHAR